MFCRLTRGLVAAGFIGLAVATEAREPDWIHGSSSQYPSELYLIGVGYGDNRKAAEDAAYAALARIFKAEIQARTTEWENYLQTDAQGETQASRQFRMDQATTVSTQKVLENVRITEVWRDESTAVHYALAVMDRRQAGSALRERITALDLTLEELLKQAREAKDKLRKVRALHQAIETLLLRDAYRADLRIVNPRSTGLEPPAQMASVRQTLQDFLNRSFRITVEVSGKHSERIRSALVEALNAQGLPVSRQSDPDADVVVVGTVAFEPVEMSQAKFVRWSVSFELRDLATRQVIGNVNRQGREGHLTALEAEARAVRAAQQELVEHLTSRIVHFIYGTGEK